VQSGVPKSEPQSGMGVAEITVMKFRHGYENMMSTPIIHSGI